MKYNQQFNNPVLQWSEAVFQSNVIRLAKSLGYMRIYHTKDSRGSEAGFPDLVMIHGKTKQVLFVELKSQGGRVSAAQELWLDDLRLGGQFAEVWRPSDWVSRRVEKVLRGGASVARAR
ncbi:VRR-NUC domain-containing protein [Glutamicibacter sp. ZJUTW]|uniref:VRR-NUC domain-containing protein n=1 Tax=Glutamicibacter sp. ZJUTW TaxID=1155384 RepID=UPI0011F1102C|nr:VRR-NUC domain-containing protein [Glutamicibacter sp. ZJUTW]QEP08750.1 VRR-NUC domain-containing protein [Glutamicibacter sp. ZJUTW]